jgi:lysyl-tRNA synthetase, class I
MFWGDSIADSFIDEYGDEAKKRQLILRDEKTLSGKPHVGSLRSFVMHAVLSDVLKSKGIDNVFYYEINDTDAFDNLPSYVPAEWEEHLGKRLKDVPSPDGKADNYAMYFAQEYMDALIDSKYNAEYYIGSEKYESGEYDKYIKLALDHKDDIRKIYREVSGSEKSEDWYPCQVVCDECRKIATTKITSWDGEEVEYSCSADRGYTKGCGHTGKKSPLGGEATLPWKVEWAAKFCVLEVDLEGAGKDHYAAGGSRHVSNKICEEIFERKHPFDVRHEFILMGGSKMSSSTGVGATAVELEQLLPRYIFRFMMIQKDVMKTINFNPEGDTVPVLFDQYDQVCADYFYGKEEEVKDHKNRIFELTHFFEDDLSLLDRHLPRFSLISFLVQMPHLDVEKKIEELKGGPLNEADKAELQLRIEYAKKWLETCGPEKYIFKIQETVHAACSDLSDGQKTFLANLAAFIEENSDADGGAIQTFIHGQKEETGLAPIEIFKSIYLSILGKESGPKAGWLLEALDNDFLLKRFKEVSQSKDAEKN